MSDLMSGAMALAMLAAFLLGAAGVKVALAKETRSRGILMIIAAAVLAFNVIVWTV